MSEQGSTSPREGTPNIRVHIERLVVSGLAVRDRAVLHAAIRAEMTRLFAEKEWNGAPTVGVQTERVDAGAFQQPGRLSDRALGARIATSVHGGLTR